MTSFSILDNIEEKLKLSFEYFWKYHGKWGICSKVHVFQKFQNW